MSACASTGRRIRRNAGGNRSDIGWQHGVDIDGTGKKVKCNYCKKEFNGGIFRFKHHLACTRKDAEPCLSVPDEVKKNMLSILQKNQEANERKRKQAFDIGDSSEDDNDVKEVLVNRKGKALMHAFAKRKVDLQSSSAQQSTLNNIYKKDVREQTCRDIARFFYVNAIPFNCARSPYFAKMIESIGRYGCGMKPPSYHEIRETFLEKEVTDVRRMIDEYKIEWKKVGCSIMSDGWTDKKRRSICNFLVNSPKGTIFLASTDTSDISKTAAKIFEMLDEIVERVGEENVVQVVTDNAANYKAAGEMLMIKRKNLFWTPCVAHCIDLILEDFEKKIELHKETIARGRKITTYIYGRTMLIALLRQFTKGKDLIRPGATRFATSYLTLGCLYDLRGSLMNMFSSQDWRGTKFSKTEDGIRVQESALDSGFWKNVVLCLKASCPLIKVLRLVDAEDKPVMGFIYDAIVKAKEKIQLNFNNVKRSYEPILRIIDERWDFQLHQPLHAAGYYLNPHFHYDPDFNDNLNVKIGLYNCLDRMVPNSNERLKIDKQLDIFHKAMGLFGRESVKNARKEKEPADWWDSYGDECPELKRFAVQILSLTCSSSGCERNWSAFEMVHTKKRNHLHQKKMNDLVFVMYNTKLKDRRERVKGRQFAMQDVSSDDEWLTQENVSVDGSTFDLLSILDENIANKDSNEDQNQSHNSVEELLFSFDESIEHGIRENIVMDCGQDARHDDVEDRGGDMGGHEDVGDLDQSVDAFY